MHRHAKTRIAIAFIILLFPSSLIGCRGPSATLDLITVARKALTDAKTQEDAQHTAALRAIISQQEALDTAFDADVRLAAAGQIKDADGNPVALTAEWVISARKGYAATRSLLAQQTQQQLTAHATRQDNLSMADEALQMASELIVRQYAIGEQLQQYLIQAQRSMIHGQ